MTQTLVTVADYRLITNDQTTAASTVTARLEDALDEVQDALGGRLLESTIRTETVEMWVGDGIGYVYPKATPVTAVSSPDGALVDENASRIRGVSADPITGVVWPFPGPGSGWSDPVRASYATVTYTGGFTHDTLPSRLRRAIALVARGLILNRQPLPVGTTSARVGDVALAGTLGDASYIESLAPGVSKMIAGYRPAWAR